MFPIALHISDSTLHILQCPSRIPHSGRRYSFGNAAFPPSAAHGFSEGILIRIAPLSLSEIHQTLLYYHTIHRKSSTFPEKFSFF